MGIQFAKGEELFSSLKDKDHGRPGVYFVVKGTLNIKAADGTEVATLVAPFTFGETAVLENMPMRASFCLMADCTSFSATVESEEMDCLLLSVKDASTSRRYITF
jgi:hypothetical protein